MHRNALDGRLAKKSLGEADKNARRAAQDALKLDPKHRGARALLEKLGQD
jgi:hypothetical protein